MPHFAHPNRGGMVYDLGDKFHMGDVDPRSLHPNMDDVRGSGMGGVDAKSGTAVGYVSTSFLKRMQGNPVHEPQVRKYERKLLSGEGFHYPIMLEYHHDTGSAYVGEGNHRMNAAYNLGVSHVPAYFYRSSSSPKNVEGRSVLRGVRKSEEGWPFTGSLGEERVPTQIHPKWILHKDLYLPEPSGD